MHLKPEEERSDVDGTCGVSAAGSARVEEISLRALQQRSGSHDTSRADIRTTLLGDVRH